MADTTADATADVVVVGGGLIGLASAWRLAQAGLSVVVADPAPARSASRAAAGMLAPVTEVHYGEEALLALNLDAAARYPSVVAELADLTGADVGYRRCGTLTVALDSGDRAELDRLHGFQLRLGLAAVRLSGRECRELEPLLAPGVRGGVLVAGDHQVDNRRLAAALLTACDRIGVTVRPERVAAVLLDGERVRGVTLDGGDRIASAATVVAAGAWSATLPGLPAGLLPVRPVKGQILRLTGPAEPPLLRRNLRAVVTGSHVYLVPRATGEVVVGATMEEMGYDTTVRAGAVHALLRDAQSLLPQVRELELAETTAALRPGSPDNGPMIGETSLTGLVAATGHYRNGVLLTPLTADAVAAAVTGLALPDAVVPFSPLRFGPVGARL